MAFRAPVFASGDQRIDGILSGNKWDGTIWYAFPTSVFQYPFGYDFNNLVGFEELGADQKRAVHFGLNTFRYNQWNGAEAFAVEAFTNLGIGFTDANSPNDILVANSDAPPTAFAFYPSNTLVESGDAFFGGTGRNPVAGNLDWHTVLHELGHSLGLKHGHETDTFGALPSNVDSMEFTLMTYRSFIGQPVSGYSNDEFSYAQTFMMLDIAALQHMYGANFGINAGDTTYKWSPGSGDTYIDGKLAIDAGGKDIFLTIWDGNGVDTFDLTDYKTDLDVSLVPGAHSVFSRAQLADLNGGPNGGLARGSVFNALQFRGDDRSLIENVLAGGGDDTIEGNDAANRLNGALGNDDISGGFGEDTLLGGNEDDKLEGEQGHDRLRGHYGRDTLNGGNGDDTIEGGIGPDNGKGGLGDDRIFGEDAPNGLRGGMAGNNAVSSDDTLMGRKGHDTLSGQQGDDNLKGQNGDDHITGGLGNDTMKGHRGDEDLNGSAGDDLMEGGGNNDHLAGNNGNDRLEGGGARDTLDGGWGNDTLRGGFGDDKFVFRKRGDRDIVEDYDGDRLDLRTFNLSKNQVMNRAEEDGAYLKFDFGGGDQLWLRGTSAGDVDLADLIV